MIYFNKKTQPYVFPVLWLLFTALLQVIGKPIFRYESDVVSSFEVWRLLTAHWVHLNWTHWLLNNFGFILLVAITRVNWNSVFWIKLIIAHSLFISSALLFLNPQLHWYVGFSGVLYGLYIVAAMMMFKKEKIMSLMIMAIVMIKIGSEQIFGSEVSSQALLGAPVVVDAHAYGVACGLCMSILLLNKVRLKESHENK